MKKLYLYENIDRCEPGSGAYHEDGGLVVITSGYPNDAVKAGTGNMFTVTSGGRTETKFGLPEADLIVVVSDETLDAVYTFPNAGCC